MITTIMIIVKVRIKSLNGTFILEKRLFQLNLRREPIKRASILVTKKDPTRTNTLRIKFNKLLMLNKPTVLATLFTTSKTANTENDKPIKIVNKL